MDMKWKLVKLESNDRYQRLFSKESGTSGIKAGHVTLAPGEKVGEHTTGEREEVLVIINGRGEAVLGEKEKVTIEKNTSLYIPPETGHDIKNTGDEPLEYVFITSQANVF